MKKIITTKLMLLVMVIGLAVGFSSCGDDYYPGPGPGGTTFIDSDLTGGWRLYAVNGIAVSPGQVNYLQFNGNSNGRYYTMSNGRWYWENISYWSKYYGSGDYELNIQYSDGSSASMIYWFSGRDDLYMRWNTANGQVLYHYVYTTYLP